MEDVRGAIETAKTSSEKIRRFYLGGFEGKMIHRAWPHLWSKQFKIRTHNDSFIKLNRFRDRLNFKSLKRFCVHFVPQNLYMSALNWLMPERVGEKGKANCAYPVGGEYVVDFDVPQFWRPYGCFDSNGLSLHGYQIAKDRTLEFIEKVRENYRDIRIVFSGKRGFHVHVLDFEVRDWTHYDPKNPIKSHEIARLVYTQHLQSSLGRFSKYHFILSVDPMRVMAVPGSLNGKTGLICFYVGGVSDFEDLTLDDVVKRSDAKHFLYNNGFINASNLIHAHPEPVYRGGQ